VRFFGALWPPQDNSVGYEKNSPEKNGDHSERNGTLWLAVEKFVTSPSCYTVMLSTISGRRRVCAPRALPCRNGLRRVCPPAAVAVFAELLSLLRVLRCWKAADIASCCSVLQRAHVRRYHINLWSQYPKPPFQPHTSTQMKLASTSQESSARTTRRNFEKILSLEFWKNVQSLQLALSCLGERRVLLRLSNLSVLLPELLLQLLIPGLHPLDLLVLLLELVLQGHHHRA